MLDYEIITFLPNHVPIMCSSYRATLLYEVSNTFNHTGDNNSMNKYGKWPKISPQKYPLLEANEGHKILFFLKLDLIFYPYAIIWPPKQL